MRSIAIWSTNKTADSRDIELHFNLWKLPIKGGFLKTIFSKPLKIFNDESYYSRFIDIGVMIDGTKNLGNFNIFIPYALSNNDVCDITSLFVQDTKLVNAVFNENYNIVSNRTSKTHVIQKENNQEAFSIYELSDSDMSLEKKYKGTIIKLKILETDKKIYFRIRIKGGFAFSLSTIQKPSNSFIQSAFSKNEIIDFRVNEARDLDNSLLDDIRREQGYLLRKVHFFFVCSSNEDITNSHTPFLNCRNLEQELWKNYIGEDYDDDGGIIIAYHWKNDKNKDNNDYNVLIKSKFEKNSWGTIFIYLIILFALTLLFNLISALIYDYLKTIIKL